MVIEKKGGGWRGEGRKRTGLNLRPLLLIRKKLAQLRLIFIVELFEIKVLDSSLCGVHGRQPKVSCIIVNRNEVSLEKER